VPNVDQLLADARARLERLEPDEAQAELDNGALLIEIRSDSQRAADGVVPGAAFAPCNVRERRLDPASPQREPELARLDRHIVLMCDEGYQSSLAAATLQELGLPRATDLGDGFRPGATPACPSAGPRSSGTGPPARSVIGRGRSAPRLSLAGSGDALAASPLGEVVARAALEHVGAAPADEHVRSQSTG